MKSGKPATRSRAFVLGRVTYGEADLVVHLLTEEFGRVSAMARGARRGGKRFAGSLEPMHTIVVSLVEKPNTDLFALRDAELDKPRLGITRNLDAIEVAGQALGWLKKATPAQTPERDVFSAIEAFLDELDGGVTQAQAPGYLAAFGIRLIDAFGWGLELRSCIACGRSCPDNTSALINPGRGGLVCRACGGGPLKVSALLRQDLIAAAAGELHTVSPDDTPQALRIIERALGAHAGIE